VTTDLPVGRAFLAVHPPEEVLEAVAGSVASARESRAGPRWVGREQWHLTVQFLGRVASLAPVVDGLAALSAFPAFTLRLGGGGAFPNARRARVIWIGATAGGERLAEVAGVVAGILGPLGYEADQFRPHLTVARLRVPGDVSSALAALGRDPVGPDFRVEEVILSESRLSPRGPTYTALARFPLRLTENA